LALETEQAITSRKWLRSRPYLFETWDISAVHSSFACPEKWNHLITSRAAADSFRFQPTDVAFFGHTHTQEFWNDENNSFTAAKESVLFSLHPNRRHAINPGSVGNPCDETSIPESQAHYLIYEKGSRTVTFIRLTYI